MTLGGARQEPSWHRRLFALSGLVPLGFFLLEHTWANASALRGQAAYIGTINALARVPLLTLVEVTLVFIPLAYHALYGAWLMREPIPEGARPYNHRALAVANRGAAVFALVFIVWHFWEYRVHAWRYGLSPQAFYSTLVWRLSSTWHGLPISAVLYLAGVLSTIFHFALSSWGYGVTSGYFSTKLAKTRAAYACLGLGALLSIVSAATVVSLATGIELSSDTASTPCTKK